MKNYDWLEVTKYKGKNPYKGHSIKDFYLNYCEKLGTPLKMEEGSLNYNDNAIQISEGIKAIEELQNKLILREKDVAVFEENIKKKVEKLEVELEKFSIN